ncbi:MAG: putative 7-carboxy-7-deazaguanine synthase QueE [Oscillospiraceae bacterium]|nr:putative 7-carboxy-7-deazaguanine synthase QueE [Oscillospiraceae bacterium]
MNYKIAEIFESINGEGRNAGQLAVFIRFAGCNLDCPYCDTKWANDVFNNRKLEIYNSQEVYSRIKQSGINLVTITGGEPLIQPEITDLLQLLSGDLGLGVEIETNGSADISIIDSIKKNRPSLTMDYKLPSSGMEGFMLVNNLTLLNQQDTVKFVVRTKYDLIRSWQILNEYDLLKRCAVYLSPVYGKLEPPEIVEFMKEKKLNGVRLQLQLHKHIWGVNERGV